MQAYKYKAISKDGKKVNGVVEAYDEYEAVAKIKETCKIVEKIEAVEGTRTKKIDLNEPLSISEKALALTARQFAILLRSGLQTSRTVEVIAGQTSEKYLKKILTEVAEDVSAGYSLAASLENRGKKIPSTFIETVRAGEESGTLDKAFEKLATYYEKSHKLHSKVRGAMIYPAFLAVLAVLVVIIVVKVTVPTVAEMIISTGGELPWPTRFLLGAYDFFENWGILVLIIILALVLAYRYYAKTETGKMRIGQRAFKLPILGNINYMNAASQFASTMTTLLTSGLPITKALGITGKVMDNYAAGTSIAKCAVGIEEGKRLGEVMKGNPYLPELLVEMTSVGEESGALEDTLTTIGEYYDSEVEQSTSKALGMLEPAITVVMGIIIGFIVIALYLPMFTMYNSM